MAYFTITKLSELATARSARAAYVREAQYAAADNVYLVEHVVKRVLPLAREEATDFFNTFEEPLPHHLRWSLDAEVNMWERLASGLETLARREVTEQFLDEYTRRVRSYLACQEDLLRMEEEMVHSCLVQHYDRLRESILARAAAYDITNV